MSIAGKAHPNLSPLYSWYQKNKRELPFRKTRDAYRVWVSEVMLQQTRVAAMLEAYEKFMASFPNLKSLANAPLEKVLVAWQGLGYYRRASNLHNGAKRIIKKHKGIFPKDLKAALAIPGVGPYTAAAVLSICYKKPLPVLDGNVTRVLTRLYSISKISPAPLKAKAQLLIEGRGLVSPGKHNQALMELGALFCLPKDPKCPQCPLKRSCLSWQERGRSKSARIPIPKKEKFIELKLRLWLIFSEEQRSLLILKEKNSRFFKNLWFLPYAFHTKSSIMSDSKSWNAPHFPEILSSLAMQKRQKVSQNIRHSITNHKIKAQVEAVLLNCKKTKLLTFLKNSTHGEKETQAQWLWIRYAEAREYLINSLSHKALRAFQRHIELESD